MKKTLCLTAAGLILAGCGGPKPVASNQNVPDSVKPDVPVEGSDPGTTDPIKKPGVPTGPGTGTPKDPDVTKPNPPVNPPTIKVTVPDAGTAGWRSTKITIEELGQNIGDAMKGLRNTKADTTVIARTSEGEGTYKGEIAVVDATKYKIDYVVNAVMPMTGTDVANGVNRVVRLGEKFSGSMPAGKPLAIVNRPAASWAAMWMDDFGRMSFQGLTDGKDAWAPVFKEWKTGAFGFQPIVEERQMLYKNRMITNYRVRVERNAAMSKKLGPCSLEVVIDGQRYLPVTIRVERKDTKGKAWMTQWSAHWMFQEEFPDSKFAMPTQSS